MSAPQQPPQPTQQQQMQAQEIALGVANFLRNNATLKQRQGLLNNSTVDFFRFKRAARALLSDEYKEYSANPKNRVPPVQNLQQAKGIFALLINNRLVLRGDKLHTKDAREKGLSPKKGLPCLQGLPTAELTDNEYYVWLFQKKSGYEKLMAFGLIAAVFTLVLFPLWPMFMRRGVWYLSVGFLGLLGLLFVIAIIRLILFCITYFAVSPGLWLFPNLFEDVGFIDSFKPFYAWHEPKQKKMKVKKEKAQSPAVSAGGPTAQTTGSDVAAAAPVQRRKVVLEEVDE